MFYQSKSNKDIAVNLDHVDALKVEQCGEEWFLSAVYSDSRRVTLERDKEERPIRAALKYLLDRLDYKTYVCIEGGNVDAYL